MKILVTGASGLVGNAIRIVAPEFPHHKFIFCTREDADLTKPDQVEQLFIKHQPDYIIHAAAQFEGIGGNQSKQADFYYNNVLMNTYIIHFSNKYKIKKFIAASSTTAFPTDYKDFVEDDMHKGEPYGIHFAYAYSKRALDVQIRAYNKQYSANYCSVISGNLFGPHDNYDLRGGNVLPSLIHKLFLAKKNQTPLSVWGDGSAQREFIFSLDLAKISLNLLDLDTPLPDKILVSTHNEFSIKDMAYKMAKLFNFNGDIVFNPNKTNGQIRKKSQSPRLKNLLPDNQFTNLDESLLKTFEWVENNYPNIRGAEIMYFIKNVEESQDIMGVKQLNLDTFSDFRGDIWTLYTDCNFLPKFAEDKLSVSKRGVLRGLHGDSEIDKLILCLHGHIQLAVLDLRENSPTYGNTQMFELSDTIGTAIFVPAGCVNGHLCLSDKCIFFYKWSKKYNGADKQVTIKWDDPVLNLNWKIKNPIMSERDLKHAQLAKGIKL